MTTCMPSNEFVWVPACTCRFQNRFGYPHQRTTQQIVPESLTTLAATGEVADRQAQPTSFFLCQVAGRDGPDHGDRDSERGSRTPPLYSLSNA